MKPLANPVFTALDTPDADKALALARDVKGAAGGVKFGKEFFTANGPGAVMRAAAETGLPVFLDLKFHDIPNTVAGAVRSALAMRPFMLNVHAAGGPAMMRAAAGAAAEAGADAPLVLAVTVLTSLDSADLEAVGQGADTRAQAVRLAKLAQDAGLGGAVCSAHEISALREACGADFKLVVPGVRPAWAAQGDQKRVMTPKDALSAGADYLVIGRPITAAADPGAAARRIAEEINAG
ncbi:MAG: orotidine-5'-phosphate decarboxylase [Rhodospirillales bacterium]